MSEMRHDIARVLDNLHDGLYFVDRKRRITYWNKAAIARSRRLQRRWRHLADRSILIGRWGGEEFVGLFSNANAEILTDIAERLCMLVRNSRVETDTGPLCVTISTGGTISTIADTPLSILKRADAMMYRSKQNGRDRVTIG